MVVLRGTPAPVLAGGVSEAQRGTVVAVVVVVVVVYSALQQSPDQKASVLLDATDRFTLW